jgi:3-oxoacyl-[acyl-carrier protein] reductase
MPKTPDYFAGKTIIITGAASGIGRATALIFAREKANVICADIDENGVKETAEKINAIGSQALALTIDVTKRGAVEDMVQLAIDGFGTVHFLFNSAGAAIRRAKFLEIDDDLFDRTFDLNVKGTLYPMQAVLPHMLANKFGVIVNMGSMSHRRGGPGSSVHYAAAKGAVVTMTMGVAREFAAQGIRALSISPGPVRTPFQAAASSSPELVQRFLEDVPIHVFGCLHVHDRRYCLCEWRRRLALSERGQTASRRVRSTNSRAHVLHASNWEARSDIFNSDRRRPAHFEENDQVFPPGLISKT